MIVKNARRRPKPKRWHPRRCIQNVFCPTGQGGGVDPTCSPSTNLPAVGAEVRIGGSKYWAEPFDSDDTFPPAIAGFEIKDGHIFYTGRNGSEGVVTGTRTEAQKWMQQVKENIQINPPADYEKHDWQPRDGGSDNVAAAKSMVEKASTAFGVPVPEVRLSVAKRSMEAGEHGQGQIQLSNAHLSTPSQLNFKTPGVSQEVHTAAHEVAHAAYSHNPGLGKQAVNELSSIGQSVSMYHSLAGHFEGLMEAGAAYVHSPEALKKYNPSIYGVEDNCSGISVGYRTPFESILRKHLKCLRDFLVGGINFPVKCLVYHRDHMANNFKALHKGSPNLKLPRTPAVPSCICEPSSNRFAWHSDSS